MVKITPSVSAPIVSAEAAGKVYTFAGLPLSTGITYALLFAICTWLYSSLWSGAPFIVPDSPSYVRAAQDLADFRVDDLNSRPPGYPLLLVFTGFVKGAQRPLFYTSLILHFVSVWLIAALLHALGLRPFWLVSFAAVLLLPPYVEYTAYVLSDNLSTFLLVVSFVALVFWFLRPRNTDRWLLLSGIAMGCSALTRPTYQVLGLVATGFLFIARWAIGDQKKFTYRTCAKASAILLASSALLIGSYGLLNYVKFNFFGIYPMTGFNFSTRTVRFLERLPNEYAAEREALIKARDAVLVKRDGDHTAYLSYWKAVPELERITGLKPLPDLSLYLLRLHLLLIKKAPLNYLQEVFISFSNYWLPSATEVASMNSTALHIVWVALHFGMLALFLLQLVVICGLAVFGLSKRLFLGVTEFQMDTTLFSAQVFAYFLAGTIVLYNALATSMVEVGDPRYRIPTEPLIIFMCFLGLFLWRQFLIHPRFRFAV